MSILQEYEQIRKELGHTKYDSIEEYIDIVCPKDKFDKYSKELTKLKDLPYDQWCEKKKELEDKYSIVLLSDVLYKKEHWNKFDKWFNEKIKPFFIINYDDGFYSVSVNESDFINLKYKNEVANNGYRFEEMIKDYISEKLPHLESHITYDSEAGMFSANSKDIRYLEELSFNFMKDLSLEKEKDQEYEM